MPRTLEEARDSLAETLASGVIDTLVETGAYVEFYGAAEHQFKLGIEGAQVAFEVIEDEQDGYRSSLGTVCISQEQETIFFRTPIARVKVEKLPDNYVTDYGTSRAQDGWHLIDTDSHVWLKWGTDNSEDYYPSFMFDYSPKEIANGRAS